jgi:hypothetical protein
MAASTMIVAHLGQGAVVAVSDGAAAAVAWIIGPIPRAIGCISSINN